MLTGINRLTLFFKYKDLPLSLQQWNRIKVMAVATTSLLAGAALWRLIARRQSQVIQPYSSPCNWTPSLPREIRLHIFSYLDVPDLLSIRTVSINFRDIASDTSLWRPISISLGLDAERFEETRKALIAFMAKAKGIASVENSKGHTEIITHQKKWTLDNIYKLDAWIIRLEIDKNNRLPDWIKNRLKKQPTPEDTKTLKQGVSAYYTLVTWKEIAKNVSLPTSDLDNLCSIEDAVNKVTYFSGWLKGNELQLSQLTILHLSSNQLPEIPKEIGNLLQLTILDLSSNQLPKIPKEIGDLLQLTILNLSSNQLPKIPKEIRNLLQLKDLDLSHNELKEIPKEIGKLLQLTDLYLSFNQIQVIPKEIGKLFSLKRLYLSHNELKEIPKEIGNLLQLTDLNLFNNQIQVIPKDIEKLLQLTDLHLSFNQIQVIPKEIGKLFSLKRLYLSHNELKEIPKEIGNLLQLTYLNLSSNQLPRALDIRKIVSKPFVCTLGR